MAFNHVPGDTHAEVWDEETRESFVSAKWHRFCREAETALGHDLDGDSAINGFSMDEAYDQFLLGVSGRQYARFIKERGGYNPE